MKLRSMTNHRSTYANRFNALAIRRPQPAPPAMTDEQFEEWVTTLPPLGQTMARFGRALGAPHSVARARADAQRQDH